MPKTDKTKKPSASQAAPTKVAAVKTAPKKITKKKKISKRDNQIYEKRPRNFGIGSHIQPKRDLTRFVKWPKYIRVQKQKAILQERLKVPGIVNQFTKTADSNTAQALFKFLHKYRPETRAGKKQRLFNAAKAAAESAKKEKEAKKQAGDDKKVATKPPKPSAKPKVVKYGLNHVTRLVETKRAKLVIIAHDVDPLELVLWLPTLCRKKDVPYLIVKSKARLGTVVHKKTSAVLAITTVNRKDEKEFAVLIQKARDNYNNAYYETVKRTGGKVMGPKFNANRKIQEKKIIEQNK